ncbi:hypothetical protein ACQKE8_18310 [Sphingobium limneticum]|jgi:hypothetical protein|uniref:hypothetical protein n=1 Tax=Sphingobium TaxID=165695 RepID=UPI003137BFE7
MRNIAEQLAQKLVALDAILTEEAACNIGSKSRLRPHGLYRGADRPYAGEDGIIRYEDRYAWA